LLAAAYLRFQSDLPPVAQMVHFGARRQMQTGGLHWRLLFDLLWHRVGRLAVAFAGYFPASSLALGSRDESARCFYDHVNWSLSEHIIRIKIPVGIAYGSDTDLAEKLLLQAAKTNPLVLKSPKPTAVFLRFGDNALNFELRVYVKNIDDWIPMLHSMNLAIDKEFRQAGITIAFPQRDVHLDTTGPLGVRVVSDSSDSETGKRLSAV